LIDFDPPKGVELKAGSEIMKRSIMELKAGSEIMKRSITDALALS